MGTGLAARAAVAMKRVEISNTKIRGLNLDLDTAPPLPNVLHAMHSRYHKGV
jgi:hypothetical protein